MRTGTLNLEGKWTAAHKALLVREDCDVWLLTEVPASAALDGFHPHFGKRETTQGKWFSAIFSKAPLHPLSDPHPASAAAVIDGITFCCSILPWSTCAGDPDSPWKGGALMETLFHETLNQLAQHLPRSGFVWGGDWNQNLIGGWEHVGSNGASERLGEALDRWELQVPTAGFAHRLAESHSIDHIAVPNRWRLHRTIRIDAIGLSDHDAYIIDVEPRHSKDFLRSERPPPPKE